MQDFELESSSREFDHSQKVKEPTSEECLNSPSSNADSWNKPAKDHSYFVLAYYLFQTLDDPRKEIEEHKKFLSQLDATCRIYISHEGINGQLSILREQAHQYIDWMHSRAPFRELEFKIHGWHEQAFPRLTIKFRKHLVARDREINLHHQGQHVAPAVWKQMLEEEKDALLLDVRNDYEWKVGRFEGAELPPCEKFRDFEKYAETLKEQHNPKTKKVMMYCTGGIRCEVYSALLKDLGFENVYQLQGGIIKYGLEQGNKHWQGKLFVFDDRLTVPISEEAAPPIGTCHHCGATAENYYNCANMDCNALFLACPNCVEKHVGCCQEACTQSPRLRPYQQQNPHKPFRRKHFFVSSTNEPTI